METTLNKKINDYYKDNKNNFNVKNLQQSLSNINEENEYGGIAHAVVNYEYSKDFILGILKFIFSNKISPNVKGKNTGYSYIHLALYGYTDAKGNDHSYETDFIVSLINLGKEYGLDVNIQDNDGDSIIHTALASEVYTGKILPIIEALGNKFNLEIKDKQGRGIKEALEFYIKEAENSGNATWLNRLKSEKDSIIAYLDITNLDTLKNKLEALYKVSTPEGLFSNLESIKKLEAQITNIINANNKTSKSKIDLNKYFLEYHELARKIITSSIKSNLETPRKKDIQELKALISYFKFGSEQELTKINNKYKIIEDTLKSAISAAITINSINEALKLIKEFPKTTPEEEKYLNDSKSHLEKEKEALELLIVEIKGALTIKALLKDWLATYIEEEPVESNNPELDYNNLPKNKLQATSETLKKGNVNLKKKVFTNIKTKISEIYSSLNGLVSNKAISKEEIDNLTEETYQKIFTPRK